MRFGPIVMTYFVIGAVMWAGGGLAFGQAGVVGVIFDDVGGSDGVTINSSTSDQIQRTGGPIQEAVASVGGSGLLAVYQLAAGFFGFLFWPITALIVSNAPPRAVVVLGGIMTLGFILGFIRLIASSG